MRSIFALWSDHGRPDYSILARPKSHFGARLTVSLVALAVAAVGIRAVFSEVITSDSPSDRVLAGTVTAGAVTAGAVNAAIAARSGSGETDMPMVKPRAPLQSIGLTPIGSVDGPAMAAPPPARYVTASAEHSATAGEPQRAVEAPAAKQDDKQRSAKKKYAHSGPATRRPTVRYAGDFQAWGSYAATRSSRSARAARPYQYQFGSLY